MVDWQILATIAAPIIALIVGVWIARRFESRPKLLTHWGHVSSFNYTREDGTIATVNTHSVVLRNVGRRAATNVRMSHHYLPSFKVWPAVQYRVEDVPNSGQDIVVPILIPNQNLTVSYLYFPPITYAQVNSGVKCDQGFAIEIPVLLQRQYPSWVLYLTGILMIVGASTLAYGLFELAQLVAALMSG